MNLKIESKNTPSTEFDNDQVNILEIIQVSLFSTPTNDLTHSKKGLPWQHLRTMGITNIYKATP